ncbi:MAG: single-stranded DNA-binding protein [Verrucomicrobia bacterium]|nr:single-stranded DNA-binding protein [Verrucomicrobiota bacterium]
MASYNKVILLGNLTRDPELRYTPKGTAVARLGLAVNRSYKSETGETKEEVTFLDVDAWGKQAELIGQYLRKGNPLFVEGRLRLDQWDDKQTGQKRSALKVVMENFQFIGGRAEGVQGAVAPSRPPSRPAGPAEPPTSDGPPPEEDDVPF